MRRDSSSTRHNHGFAAQLPIFLVGCFFALAACQAHQFRDPRVAEEWRRHREVMVEGIFPSGDPRPLLTARFFTRLTGIPVAVDNSPDFFYFVERERRLRELDDWLENHGGTLVWDEGCSCVARKPA